MCVLPFQILRAVLYLQTSLALTNFIVTSNRWIARMYTSSLHGGIENAAAAFAWGYLYMNWVVYCQLWCLYFCGLFSRSVDRCVSTDIWVWRDQRGLRACVFDTSVFRVQGQSSCMLCIAMISAGIYNVLFEIRMSQDTTSYPDTPIRVLHEYMNLPCTSTTCSFCDYRGGHCTLSKVVVGAGTVHSSSFRKVCIVTWLGFS